MLRKVLGAHMVYAAHKPCAVPTLAAHLQHNHAPSTICPDCLQRFLKSLALQETCMCLDTDPLQIHALLPKHPWLCKDLCGPCRPS